MARNVLQNFSNRVGLIIEGGGYDCLLDSWFRFGFALVLLMIGETWLFNGLDLPTAPLRLLRLFRLARMIPATVTSTK